MRLNDRIGLRLVAGASLIALVGCASGGNSTTSTAPTTPSSPILAQNPLDQTKTVGQTATFTVAASANGTLSYQWQKGGVDLAGATSATYTTPVLTAGLAGAYACKVTNTLGASSVSLTSSAANLMVNVPPAIATQPVAVPAISVGGTASFTVTATGNGALSYQWQKDGVAIPASLNVSAITATLTLTNLRSTDAGAYTCVVTATLNGTRTTVTSAAAVLGVAQLPIINTQPAALQTVVQGAPVAFSVDASPTAGGTLSYQWLRNGVAIDAAANPSAATASLSLASAQASDVATYTCAITNTAGGLPGTAVTSAAVLAVNVPPTVTAPAASQTAGQGGTLTLSVTATAGGPGTLTYQWFKAGVALVNGASISGATTATLTLANVSTSDAASYTCVVTNTLNGTITVVTSAIGSVSVIGAPVITTQPAGTTVAQGGSAAFTVAATGSGILSYQWMKNGTAIDATANPSAATATLNLSALAATDAASYTCVVTNTDAGLSVSTTSAAAVLAVNHLSITIQPATTGWGVYADPATNAAPNSTGKAQFTVSVASAPGAQLTYRWSKAGTPLTDNIATAYTLVDGSGSTGSGKATLTLDKMTSNGVDKALAAPGYACTITSTLNGTTTSVTTDGSALLVVPATPSVGTLTVTTNGVTATPANVIPGQSVTLALSGQAADPLNGAPGTVSYYWYNPSGTTVLGVTSTPSFTFTVNDGTFKGTYGSGAVKVVNQLGTNYTKVGPANAITINVNGNALQMSPTTGGNANLLEQSATDTTPATQSLFTTIANGGTNGTVTYVWKKDGNVLSNNTHYSGTTTGALGIKAPVSLGDAGTYTCTMTGVLAGTPNQVASAQTVVQVVGRPTFTQPTNFAVDQGQTATFTLGTVSANGNPGYAPTLSYQWYRNGVALVDGGRISGAKTATLTLANAQSSDNATTATAWTGTGPVSVVSAFPSGYACVVTSTMAANGGASAKTSAVCSNGATLQVNPSVATPVVTVDPFVAKGQTNLVASTQDQGPYVTCAWKLVDNTGADVTATWATSATNLRSLTYTVPGATTATSVTASVTVNSTMPSTATGSAVATVKTFTMPDVVAPSLVHPGDTWMKAFTSDHTAAGDNVYPTETYAWSIPSGNAFGAITSGATTPAATFSVDPLSPNGTFLNLQVQGTVSGVSATNTAKINVKTGVWITKDGGSSAVIGGYPASVTLANGRILVAGGGVFSGGSLWAPSAAAQIFDPATGAMIATGNMNVPRYQHTLTLLPNGSVLAVGGISAAVTVPGSQVSSANTVYLNSAELWDPATGLWTLLPNAMTDAHYGHCAILFPTGNPLAGQVAILGGRKDGSTATQRVEVFNPATGTWTSNSVVLTAGRYQATASLLRTGAKSGQVWIAGGGAATSEFFDPANPTTLDLAGPALKQNRAAHTATMLTASPVAASDGTVLLVGGANSTAGQTAEIYDPVANTTTALAGTPVKGGMIPSGTYPAAPTFAGTGRQGHTATLLPDGTVLLAGGSKSGGTGAAPEWTVELYTPAGAATGTFAYTGAAGNTVGNLGATGQGAAGTMGLLNSTLLEGRAFHTAALIPASASNGYSNGGVAFFGGLSNSFGTSVNGVETFKAGASPSLGVIGMGLDRVNHATVRLPDGRVMVLGGYALNVNTADNSLPTARDYRYLTSVRIFDPATSSWTSTGDLVRGRRSPAAAVLPNGDVLVTGGSTSSSLPGSAGDLTAELWDHTSGTWSAVGAMKYPRLFHAMQVLPNGNVLVMGGSANIKVVQDGSTGAWSPDPTGILTGTTTGNATATVVYQACEVYDATLKTFSLGALTSEPKVATDPVQLSNGTVVLFGGETVMGGTAIANLGLASVGGSLTTAATSSAVEAYNPATGLWSTLTRLKSPREFHNAVLLSNGQVALIGGVTAPTGADTYAGIVNGGTPNVQTMAGNATELYDFTLKNGLGDSVQRQPGLYSTALFSAYGHKGAGAALLPSGKILVVGGRDASVGVSGFTTGGTVCELYDPATDTFTATGALAVPRLKDSNLSSNPRFEFTVTTLPNGDVLVFGGEQGGSVTQIYR